jgi:NADH-quinone oxidoreductase subunit J
MLNLILYFPFVRYVFIWYFTIIVSCACFILLCTNPVFSLLSLVIVFILTSFIFILIGGEYLGLIYLIVYVGAIAILFLFVLMLLNVRYTGNTTEKWSDYVYIIFNIIIIEALIYHYAIVPISLFFSYMDTDDCVNSYFFRYTTDSSVYYMSRLMFNVFFYYLIFCAFILLFIMIGVVLLLNLNVPTTLTSHGKSSNKMLQEYVDHLHMGKVLQYRHMKSHALQRK